MNAFHDIIPIRPSRKRQLLVFYLNFLVFSTVLAMAVHVMPFLDEQKVLARWLIAFLFAAVGMWIPGKTPGHYMLSMVRYGVHPYIKERETWLSMFAGVLLVLDGCKHIVRWMQMQIAEPVMGHMLDGLELAAYHIILGALTVMAGVLILRLKKAGWAVALFVLGFQFASYMGSLPLWYDYIIQLVNQRRELQGLPPGKLYEFEFLHTFFPALIITLFALMFFVLGFTYKKIFTAKEA